LLLNNNTQSQDNKTVSPASHGAVKQRWAAEGATSGVGLIRGGERQSKAVIRMAASLRYSVPSVPGASHQASTYKDSVALTFLGTTLSLRYVRE